MTRVRRAAVAGTFYPADPEVLRRSVLTLLSAEAPLDLDIEPRLLIVPHAGYVYSGVVAATAYRLLRGESFGQVVLLGPAHFVPPPGLATPAADALLTPLGEVPVDLEMTAAAHANPAITPDAAAHAEEHSLEVQLPFLQVCLGEFAVLALVTGEVAPEEAADVLEQALAREGTIAIASSDLSHYLDYDGARARDAATAAAISELRSDDISRDDACGRIVVQAALLVARRRGWLCRMLDLRNSGDTAGGRSRVVGYGAFAIGPAL